MRSRIGLTRLILVCLATAFALSSFDSATAAEKSGVDEELGVLRAMIEREKAVTDIQNVMSKHAYYYSAGEHQRELDEIWALKTPGVSFGQDEGYWVGAASILNAYVKYHDTFRMRDLTAFAKTHPAVKISQENLGAGTMMFHTNSTPIIEVAEDGRTAKGLWYSIGQVTMTPGGRQDAQYMWERYGVDFVKEDGKWKIWHFLIHTDISVAPGGSWVEGAMQAPDAPGGPGAPGLQPGEDPDKPMPDVASGVPMGGGPRRGDRFSPPKEYPKVPQPYRTFSETFSYGPPTK